MTPTPQQIEHVLDSNRFTNYQLHEDKATGTFSISVDIPLQTDTTLTLHSMEAAALFGLADIIERAAGRLQIAVDWNAVEDGAA
jgi:hypothetical protein